MVFLFPESPCCFQILFKRLSGNNGIWKRIRAGRKIRWSLLKACDPNKEQVFVIYLWQIPSKFLDKSLLFLFSETIVLIGVLYVITCTLAFCSNKEEVAFSFLYPIQLPQPMVNVHIQGYWRMAHGGICHIKGQLPMGENVCLDSNR